MRVGAGGMVLTPGANDIVLAHRLPRVREAYRRVSMSLLDGASLGWVARMSGVSLPERMSRHGFLGPMLTMAAAEGWGVFLVGPCIDGSCEAVARLEAKHPGLRVVGTDSSVWRGTPDQSLTRTIRESGARIVLVALPSPQQEMWMLQHSAMLAPAITFGVGERLEQLLQPMPPRAGLRVRFGRVLEGLRVMRVMLQWRFGAPRPVPPPARTGRIPTPAPGRRTSGSVPAVPARRSSGATTVA